MINNLFSIPVWKNAFEISSCDIKNDLLDQITQNYEQNKNHVLPDNWNCVVHSYLTKKIMALITI
jgi:hypothetical protein